MNDSILFQMPTKGTRNKADGLCGGALINRRWEALRFSSHYALGDYVHSHPEILCTLLYILLNGSLVLFAKN